MMGEPGSAPVAPDALHRELARERIQSAHRINLVRLWGVSAFFALFLVLGGLLRLRAWTGNLDLFAIYWAITAALFWASRRFPRVAQVASLAIALVDIPMVFFLQWATFPTSPSPSGVAGFTIGVYVLLVILAALSLENWYILFTAAVGAAFEVILQHQAGVSGGAMVSTVIVMGLTAAACSYARRRLVELVARVDRDLAQQRQAERALRHAERMASLGTLAAGVAHEINTPLTYVVTNLALISERLPGLGHDGGSAARGDLAEIEKALAHACASLDETVAGFADRLPGPLRHEFKNAQTPSICRLSMVAEELARLTSDVRQGGPVSGSSLDQIDHLLQRAREGAERVRTIVRDLKVFSGPDEETVGSIDVWRVLDLSIKLVSSEIRHRARLRTEAGAVPRVMANETRLGQVFVNLLVNAVQAMAEGAVERNEVRVVTRTDEIGRAVIEVRDTGSGIPPEILSRLFDPFFTTKPAGVGTGLGLSICHGIVSGLGGELLVESVLGKGSTFRVVLPPAAPATRTSVTPITPESLPPPSRRSRILVVDDDPRIGDAVRESLATEHDVVTLTSAFDARHMLMKGEAFDLILCDLMMPSMTGMDLHEELSRAVPAQAARMVFLTGGAFTPRARAFLADVANRRLEKPFDPKGLRRFVRERLA